MEELLARAMAPVDITHPAPTAPAAVAVIPHGFALFADGPLLRLLRRLPVARRLADEPAWRVAVVLAVAWLPPFALSIHEGLAFGGTDLPFVKDIQFQVRMLIVLPLFIIAAHEAHRVTTSALKQFVDRGIVRESDRPAFTNCLRLASGWNHSTVVRLAILAIVVFLGQDLWQRALAQREIGAWYGGQSLSGAPRALAGYWLVWVTNPIFRYVHVVWLLRMLLYAAVLARIAALDLHLVATHPDRAGGLGFLGENFTAFGELVVAEGAAMAAFLANRVFHDGHPLQLFKMDILGVAVVVAAMVLGPMCVFVPKLLAAKREGREQYGKLANRYVREFEGAWVARQAPADGRPFLGTSDIQSLADMSTAYQVVNQMRFVPFSNIIVVTAFALFLMPIAPLLLTVVPAEELLNKVIRALIG